MFLHYLLDVKLKSHFISLSGVVNFQFVFIADLYTMATILAEITEGDETMHTYTSDDSHVLNLSKLKLVEIDLGKLLNEANVTTVRKPIYVTLNTLSQIPGHECV